MTVYRQSANPNATNRELDSKQIITHNDKDYDPLALSVVDQKNQIGLTNSQHDDVIEQYVEIVVDRMETQDLVEYVTNDLLNRFAEMNSIDFKEYVNEVEEGISDDNLFDELVDNVTQQYAKLPNTFGGQS